MASGNWRARAGSVFGCEKQAACGSRGMVVTNHPLASAAGTEMLAGGGNAIDAAIAALFTLSVVEPMMVGIFGGGTSLIRLADGTETVLDNLSTAPAAAGPRCYKPVSDTWPNYLETEGRANAVGATSIAVPGNLKGWCEALARYGTFDLATVIEPAIRHAERGFRVTGYLSECISAAGKDVIHEPTIAALLAPGGKPLSEGASLANPDYAKTLRAIAQEGPDLLYGGPLGDQIADYLQSRGSFLSRDDLRTYETVDRSPVRGSYRGVELIGPPPPCSGGVHVVQMLNMLAAFDLAGLGYGTAESTHLMLEVLKIAASDRAAATGDPAYLETPVERLISPAYAERRRREIDPARAGNYQPRALTSESANTTHLTVADDRGNVVASTQTINSLFGARLVVPGTGIIPNNYMYLFDPHPGTAQSVEPGKRVTSSQAPTIAYRGGRPYFALGLPGGTRIYGSAMQAIVNLVDHGMSLQEAVEAPRVWSQGQEAEIEEGIAEPVRAKLAAMGHKVVPVKHVGGGMCAVEFGEKAITGAACWRADGMPVGLGGGYARPGVRFWPDPQRG